MVKKPVRISERHFKLLSNRADYWEARGKKKEWNKGSLTERYIELGVPYFLEEKEYDKHVSEGFTSRAQKTQIEIEEKIGDDRCKGLVRLKIPGKEDYDPVNVSYICVRGSSTGTVKLKKLGVDPKEICEACKKTMNLEARWAQIRSKDKLGVEEHTYCTDGGWYDDKTGRIHCTHLKRWQDQDRCFTMAHGKPCPSLRTLPARRVKRTGIKRRKR